MKRWMALFSLLALLLTACGSAAVSPSPTPDPTETGIVDGPPWFITCRVVDTMGGTLILARNGDTSAEIYTMAARHCEEPVKDGQLINVYFETVMESWPAQFGNISKVEVTDEPADDHCGLYLQVLEDLWEGNGGLRSDITQFGIDLTEVTDLTESERAAIAYAFSSVHGLFPALTGTWEELVEQGFIDGENLYWEDGVFFSIAGSVEEFDAQIWRSGLGAYFYGDCTSQMAEDGSWSYETGMEAIS